MLTKTRDIDIDIDWAFAYKWYVFVYASACVCVRVRKREYAVEPKVNPFRHFRSTKQNVTTLFNQKSIYQFQFPSPLLLLLLLLQLQKYIFIWMRSRRKCVFMEIHMHKHTHTHPSCLHMYKIWVSSSVKCCINYATTIVSMRSNFQLRTQIQICILSIYKQNLKQNLVSC